MRPNLTVVIPVLNASEVLAACFESLASQEGNFELIIIDGGSNDLTVPIVQKFLSDRSLSGRLILEPGLGIYDAMNLGADMALGTWLFFLGSDDRMHDSRVLGEMNAILKKTEANLVYGNVLLKGSGKIYGGECDLRKLLFQKNLCHQGVFYRKSFHHQLGGYNRTYERWADWDFNIRAFSHPKCMPVYVDRVIAIYNELSGVSKISDIALTSILPRTFSHKAVAFAVCCEMLTRFSGSTSGLRVGLYGAGELAHLFTESLKMLDISEPKFVIFDEKVKLFKSAAGSMIEVSSISKLSSSELDILVVCSIDSVYDILKTIEHSGFSKPVINFKEIQDRLLTF